MNTHTRFLDVAVACIVFCAVMALAAAFLLFLGVLTFFVFVGETISQVFRRRTSPVRPGPGAQLDNPHHRGGRPRTNAEGPAGPVHRN